MGEEIGEGERNGNEAWEGMCEKVVSLIRQVWKTRMLCLYSHFAGNRHKFKNYKNRNSGVNQLRKMDAQNKPI